MIWSDLDMDMGWKWLELGDIGGPNETGRFSWPKNIRHLLNSPWATGILSVFGVFGEPYDTIRKKKNIKHRPPPRFASYILIIWYNICRGQVLCEFLWLMDVYLWLFMDITGSLLKSSHLESIHVGSWTIHQGRPWHFYQLKKQIEPWWNSMIDNNLRLSKYVSGWWFQTWLLFSIIYGMSSFPLTNS